MKSILNFKKIGLIVMTVLSCIVLADSASAQIKLPKKLKSAINKTTKPSTSSSTSNSENVESSPEASTEAPNDNPANEYAENRMPASKYTGADKAALEKKLATAYNNRYGTDVVIRVVITDPSWTKKTELVNDNTKTYERTSSYIGANVAVQRSESCTVYIATFRKDSSGKIELHSTGENYHVLNENINK